MDALMAALVTALLASADGRYGRLVHDLIALHGRARFVLSAFALAASVNTAASALGGVIANATLGQGVLTLFQGFALLGAGAALIWPFRKPPRLAALPGPDWPALTLALGLLFMGDSCQFLILTLAGTSGAGHWAALGGLFGIAIGLLPALAMGPDVYDRRALLWLKRGSAAVLITAGVVMALRAFGLL
jgi:putative Ca2+/H+ antiporter (TMEM165/GDT1 family)